VVESLAQREVLTTDTTTESPTLVLALAHVLAPDATTTTEESEVVQSREERRSRVVLLPLLLLKPRRWTLLFWKADPSTEGEELITCPDGEIT
jgi:hypothetical protein